MHEGAVLLLTFNRKTFKNTIQRLLIEPRPLSLGCSTPRFSRIGALKFYEKLKRLNAQINSRERKILSCRKRIEKADKFIQGTDYSYLMKYLNKATYTFLLSQIRNQPLTARARRYSLDEKILALSIYKNSGKGYRLLQKIYSLCHPQGH